MATLAEPIVHGHPVESELKTNTLTLFDTTVIATSSVAPAYTPRGHRGVSHHRRRPRIAGRDPRGIPAGAVHRHRVLLPEPAGPQLRSVVLVGQPHAQSLCRLGIGMDSTRPPTSCSARPLHWSPVRTRCSLLNSFGWVSSDAANDNRLIAIVGSALVAAGDLHGRSRHPGHRELPVDPRVHRVLDRPGLCALGDRQDRRRARCRQRRLRPVVQPPAVARPQRSRRPDRRWQCSSSGAGTPPPTSTRSRRTPRRSPGLAGIYSMFILLFIFLIADSAIQALISLPADQRSQQPERHPLLLRAADLGHAGGYLMVLAVLSSTVATTQTTLLPSSRLTYLDGAGRRLPQGVRNRPQELEDSVGRDDHLVRSRHRGDRAVGGVRQTSVGSVFANLILDIGVLVALYYGITGIACAWAFRKVLLTSVTRFIFAGILPLLGGISSCSSPTL